MSSLPQLGSVSICEINRDFISADSFSDEVAKETYGKILGFVFSPIPFSSDHLMPNLEQIAERDHPSETVQPRRGFSALKERFTELLKRAFSPPDLNLLTGRQGVSWHPHKHILAFISGENQVSVYDYEDSEGKECILVSESQRDVVALEWRPNGGRMLSVASKGGICIWSVSYPANAACVRPGVTPGSVSRSARVRYVLVDFLRSNNGEQISALCWNPDGRYLASASYQNSSFTIWDVSQGQATPIRRGIGAVSILKWSPAGDYFLTSKSDGTFYLWETNTWTSEPWSTAGGYVTGATWDPEGHMILLAFSESVTLGAIHFSSRFPSLDAHLLPVELPEIAALTGSHGIENIAWDTSGERLALSYKGGDDTYSGLIAVYDIRRTPLVSSSLVGFIRGPGEKPSPLAFAFHNKFKQGPLLSVCWSSGFCCTYPLIFRSHVLP